MIEKIRQIANHYSKKNQRLKTVEEIDELLKELKTTIKKLEKLKEEIVSGTNPFGFNDVVCFPGNTWAEIADVFIMLIQLIMQHNMGKVVLENVEYKVERQLRRMEHEQRENA